MLPRTRKTLTRSLLLLFLFLWKIADTGCKLRSSELRNLHKHWGKQLFHYQRGYKSSLKHEIPSLKQDPDHWNLEQSSVSSPIPTHLLLRLHESCLQRTRINHFLSQTLQTHPDLKIRAIKNNKRKNPPFLLKRRDRSRPHYEIQALIQINHINGSDIDHFLSK